MPITLRQLHPLFVGEVSNVDLRAVNGAVAAEIEAAIHRHAVLVFRGQDVSGDDQITFSRHFGPLETTIKLLRKDHQPRLPPQISDISNLDEQNRIVAANDRRRVNGLGNLLWHTDSSFKPIPARYSLLSAHVVPPEGGETEFADLRAAYDALPERTKREIADLVAEHSIIYSRSTIGFTDYSEEERAGLPPVQQVIVRTHPGSGRKTLYLASHASHIIGMQIPEGRLLLRDLMEHATQREFVYRHRWEAGDLVMWDDRCTMHRARPYDQNAYPRDMRRTTVSDERPTVAQRDAA